MSFIKFFAPPEWDADVPDGSSLENLTKKAKIRKSKKWLSGEGDVDEAPKEVYNEPKSKKQISKVNQSANINNGLDSLPQNKENSSNNPSKQAFDAKKKEKADKKAKKLLQKKENGVETLVKSEKSKNKKRKKSSHDEDGSSKKMKLSDVSKNIGILNKKIKNKLDDGVPSQEVESEVKEIKQKEPKIKQPSRKNANKKLKLKGSKPENSNQLPKPTLESNKTQESNTTHYKPANAPSKTEMNRKRRRKKNANSTSNSSNNSITESKKSKNIEKKTKSENNAQKMTPDRNVQKIIPENFIQKKKFVNNVQNVSNVEIVDSPVSKEKTVNKKSNTIKSAFQKIAPLADIKIKPEVKDLLNDKAKITQLNDKSKTISKINKKKKSSLFKSHLMKLNNVLKEQIENQENGGVPTEFSKSTQDAPETKVSNKASRKAERGQKTLRQRMMEKLKGARFRYLNEQMYVKESKDAQQIFSEDPTAFGAYHNGYRQQVSKWPLNPLDVIIKDISQLPKEYVIADLGCGDGRLSKSVPQKVHSFDLVSLDPSIQACDMSHTPLLASQCNVVVFCLSLMGTNLMDYIMEANRILKNGGTLKIAEVESRFENVETFLKDVQKFGFSLIKSDLNQNLFYFMDFKKEGEIKKRNKLPTLTLNPCLYKKR